MVGLFVAVYVAARLAGAVKSVHADRIRSGLYGQAGNKAALLQTKQIPRVWAGLRPQGCAIELLQVCRGQWPSASKSKSDLDAICERVLVTWSLQSLSSSEL